MSLSQFICFYEALIITYIMVCAFCAKKVLPWKVNRKPDLLSSIQFELLHHPQPDDNDEKCRKNSQPRNHVNGASPVKGYKPHGKCSHNKTEKKTLFPRLGQPAAAPNDYLAAGLNQREKRPGAGQQALRSCHQISMHENAGSQYSCKDDKYRPQIHSQNLQ